MRQPIEKYDTTSVGKRLAAVWPALAVGLVLIGAVSGCTPQPTWCASAIEFETSKFCAAGRHQPLPGGPIHETVVYGFEFSSPDHHETVLEFGATLLVGASNRGGGHWSFTRTSTGVVDPLGVGEHELGDDLTFLFADSTGVRLTASSGWLRINEITVADGDPAARHRVTRLSATFQVETELGRKAGAVSLSSPPA